MDLSVEQVDITTLLKRRRFVFVGVVILATFSWGKKLKYRGLSDSQSITYTTKLRLHYPSRET